MATTRILFGFICFIALGWSNNPCGYILDTAALNSSYQQTLGLRRQIIEIAKTQLNVREATGKNDGMAVEQYLTYTSNAKGDAWCASFVSWVYGRAGLPRPKTGWSPALFPVQRLTKEPLPADIFGIYFNSLKRIAHCGLIEQVTEKYIIGIEGNTNDEGAREGDGVYRKRRHKNEIRYFADWLSQQQKEVNHAP